MENGIYHDISTRTGGDIYIGVVGPVRTGKSTFIKRFMETMVLPGMENMYKRERARDELPQSGAGRTIMTAEPKFVPEEAAEIALPEGGVCRVRLVDCVGYLVEGALGSMENDTPRMVSTPWREEPMTLAEAAETGTHRVIGEHSTIGLVITTDGSFTDIPRESYVAAEEQTIRELKKAGKPFVMLLNSERPFRDETVKLAEELREKHQVSVYPVNCSQLHKEDVNRILTGILYEFPVVKMNFYMPKWIEMLDAGNRIRENVIANARKVLNNITYMKDVVAYGFEPDGDYLTKLRAEQLELSDGSVNIAMDVGEQYYYENMSEMTGIEVKGEYQLIAMVKELAQMRREYEKVADAMQAVKMRGYGVVNPGLADIHMEEPVIIHHGNKFGVKIRATSPSIHMIRANIETEIAPIVGSEEQAKDLIDYISQNAKENPDGIFDTNIFGKTIRQLVDEGIHSKVNRLTEESQVKLQDTIQKVVNDSNGGLVCIII